MAVNETDRGRPGNAASGDVRPPPRTRPGYDTLWRDTLLMAQLNLDVDADRKEIAELFVEARARRRAGIRVGAARAVMFASLVGAAVTGAASLGWNWVGAWLKP